MASKKFKGKTCAYCSRERASEAKEHVIAREFVLRRDRDNLPVVPACKACNAKKSALEIYALAVLPFGSMLPQGEEYILANMERRLAKHPKLKRKLDEGASRERMRQNGLMVPVRTMPLDHERVNALIGMTVRGLFNYEFGFPLHAHWDVRVTNFLPMAEASLMPMLMGALGPAPETVERAVGGGALQFVAWHSRSYKYCSVWQLTMFGRLKVGGDEDVPGIAFDHWSAITVRDEDAPTRPNKDEMPEVGGMRPGMAAEGRRG